MKNKKKKKKNLKEKKILAICFRYCKYNINRDDNRQSIR